jgi:hypothetical protein
MLWQPPAPPAAEPVSRSFRCGHSPSPQPPAAAAAGEHTVIMLRPLRSPDVADPSWLDPFVADFRARLMTLLSGARCCLPVAAAFADGTAPLAGGRDGWAAVSRCCQHSAQLGGGGETGQAGRRCSLRCASPPAAQGRPWWAGGGGRACQPGTLVPPPAPASCPAHTACRASPPRLAAGAFRDFPPALVLSLLDPKLSWSEAESAAAVAEGVVVRKADGAPLSPFDLKRLQVCGCVGVWGGWGGRLWSWLLSHRLKVFRAAQAPE